MANWKKLASGAAGAAGGGGLNVEDVFSTYLYEGASANPPDIVNNIDLANEGGMVWVKSRDNAFSHGIFDTERGVKKYLSSDSTSAEQTWYPNYAFDSFTSTGVAAAANGNSIANIYDSYASWTFRKAPKFFDVVTYTGNGATQTVSHNLGSVPGCIIIKCTSLGSTNWLVYHTGTGAGKFGYLNATNSFFSNTSIWQNTTPTSTQFYLGGGDALNGSGQTYVAYLFAHNDGDGDFGLTGDQDIIKCGDVIGSGTTSFTSVDLGFEPQWIMIKRYDSTGGGTGQEWTIIDNMRFMGEPDWAPGSSDPPKRLYANSSAAEGDYDLKLFPTATGFEFSSVSGYDYIYVAIRRGPMAVPTSGTDVFAMDFLGATSPNPPAYNSSGWPVDMGIQASVGAVNSNATSARLIQGTFLRTDSTQAETGNIQYAFDFQDGWRDSTAVSNNYLGYMWRRAPNYFDVVAYTGNGTAGRTVSHNLGVAPEMIWIKSRTDTTFWPVYHKDVGYSSVLRLDTNSSTITIGMVTNTSATDFTLSTSSAVNSSGHNFIAYLFASLDGISKVGSYTGNGGTQTIDCGFSNGAKFVLIKRTSDLGDWHVWDTERGIVTGNDPFLELNTTDAQNSSYDSIDPHSSGFTINNTINTLINGNGNSYIFYAIAA